MSVNIGVSLLQPVRNENMDSDQHLHTFKLGFCIMYLYYLYLYMFSTFITFNWDSLIYESGYKTLEMIP